ncbi:MAG: hypothetical protein ABJE47_11300 [bacterium]
MSIKRASALALVLAACGACGGSTPQPQTAADGSTAVSTNRNRDVITQEELQDPVVRALSVLDAIKSLRPQYLSVRGVNNTPTSTNRSTVDPEAGQAHASIDNGKVVALTELSYIHAGTVSEIRFLNPAAAMQKFGGAAREGAVILVKTTM